MEHIKQFIDSFLTAEFEANKAKWDINIPDIDAIKTGEVPKQFLYPILSYTTFGRSEGLFDDEDFRDFAPIKLSRVVKRSVFQIKKYENPTCGDVLQRILTDKSIYLCFTGSDEKDDDSKLRYSRIFVVAKTNEGLKIIYYFLFTNGKLEQMHDYEAEFVKNLGILVEVQKFQAPEELESLNDYNN